MKHKNFLFAAALLAFVSFSASAQPHHSKGKAKGHYKNGKAYVANGHYGHQPMAAKSKYYYYPKHNVYYNPVVNRYAYVNHGQWMWATSLPHGIVVASAPHYDVYYEGPTVWMANPVHVRRYGSPSVNLNISF